jgi:sedoheptulose-bisphosphatase
VVTYDPLDGSSIIDTNFSIGSIYSIWRTDERRLIGSKLADQVNAVIVIYGPRTTALIYNTHVNKVQELTLIEKEWIVSHEHLVIKEKSKMFSPGNLRAVTENEDYEKVVNAWIKKGYTLRYTGGLVPDVGQIFIKGHGVLSNIGSKSHKCKLRALYEAAAVGFLV